MTGLQSLGYEIRRINAGNGWNPVTRLDWDGVNRIPAVLALQHSEVSESLEAFRKDDLDNFIEEQADVLIRVLDCVCGLTDDFDAVVAAKLEKNRGRGYRHGGKKA